MNEVDMPHQSADEHSTNPQPSSAIVLSINNQAVVQDHIVRDDKAPGGDAVDANLAALGDIINDTKSPERTTMQQTTYGKLRDGLSWACVVVAFIYVSSMYKE